MRERQRDRERERERDREREREISAAPYMLPTRDQMCNLGDWGLTGD